MIVREGEKMSIFNVGRTFAPRIEDNVNGMLHRVTHRTFRFSIFRIDIHLPLADDGVRGRCDL